MPPAYLFALCNLPRIRSFIFGPLKYRFPCIPNKVILKATDLADIRCITSRILGLWGIVYPFLKFWYYRLECFTNISVCSFFSEVLFINPLV